MSTNGGSGVGYLDCDLVSLVLSFFYNFIAKH